MDETKTKDNAQTATMGKLVKSVMSNRLFVSSRDTSNGRSRSELPLYTYLIPLCRDEEGAKASGLDPKPRLKSLLGEILPTVRLSELMYEGKRVRLGIFDDVVTVGLPFKTGSRLPMYMAVVLAISLLEEGLAKHLPSIGMKIDEKTLNDSKKMGDLTKMVRKGAFWETKR